MSQALVNLIKRNLNNLISDKKFSEILTGSAWALGARVIATIIGMVTTVIIARFYGPGVLGIVAVINSFMLLATIFTVLGTNTAILRLIPEHLVQYSVTSAFRLYRKTQYLVIGVSLFTGTIFFISSNTIADKVFKKTYLSFYIALASVFIVFKSLMLLNTQAVRGLKLIRVYAIMQTMPQLFSLLLLLLIGLAWDNMDVPIYATLGGFALTGIMGWIIMETAFIKRKHPKDTVKDISVKKILSISLPMLMTATMTFVIGQTGVIILGIFRPESEVGYYAVAVKLATLTAFVLSAINSIIAPKFSELFHAGQIDELFRIAKKSAKLIFWTTVPILFSLIILGKLILGFVFGQKFTTAYLPMVLLILGQFVNSISGSTGIFMNMTGHQNIFRNIMLIAAILNVLINLALIPQIGINGAALAGMISLACWNFSTLVYIKMKYGRTVGYVPLL